MGAPLLHSASPPVAMPMPNLLRGASLGHHHLHKLLVVDLPIPIDVSLTDHLINLFIRKLLPKVCHHMPQLRSTDEAIPVAVKNLEGLNKLLLRVGVLHLPCHQGQELWEVNGAITICINLVDHVLQLCLRWVLPKGTHHGAQLLRCDGTITVLVEEREGLLELCDLLFCQLVCHCAVWCLGRRRT